MTSSPRSSWERKGNSRLSLTLRDATEVLGSRLDPTQPVRRRDRSVVTMCGSSLMDRVSHSNSQSNRLCRPLTLSPQTRSTETGSVCVPTPNNYELSGCVLVYFPTNLWSVERVKNHQGFVVLSQKLLGKYIQRSIGRYFRDDKLISKSSSLIYQTIF